MVAIDVLKFETNSPADTSPLEGLNAAGYEASRILAVIGKTEGNGCVNDFSRTLAQTVWQPLIPKDAITIFSGGTEGVLSPHVTFIVRCKDDDDDASGLVGAVGHTRDLDPHEVGGHIHARTVADTVANMITGMNVSPKDVKLVLVKCPLLTSTKIETARAAGQSTICTDTYESMAKSRYASAIGIAVALGEISTNDISAKLQTEDSWSALASCSSGAELDDNHIFVLANDPIAVKVKPRLKAISRPMKDAIDADAALDLLGQVKEQGGKVVQIFAKAEANPKGLIRGRRITMLTDSDIHSTRHARAAVGGLLCGLAGDTQLYVSGGAEGQGPPGGGSLTVVYSMP
ncbi:Cyanuric acid amidohydrolase [Cyphellophora attinorum]|uniref:Cyanuric acid amidohydrolase n=1 Tax=Cyphellophora attinorum TaxID=1664694 RepID=A0A0N0NJS1_9EURO|nr:Cyanuric acid amidohydrolase [Phialophora attinorum]KPI37218.1 Cyanuric acid amidohydrolase [Phialophora attinorum]